MTFTISLFQTITIYNYSFLLFIFKTPLLKEKSQLKILKISNKIKNAIFYKKSPIYLVIKFSKYNDKMPKICFSSCISFNFHNC